MGQNLTLTAADGHNMGAYRADPEGAPRGGIVVCQEIFGVNAHIREVADGFAGAGYVAIAPGLYDRSSKPLPVTMLFFGCSASHCENGSFSSCLMPSEMRSRSESIASTAASIS